MTKKHLIALDLDGTLLTDSKTISERNKRAIEAAKQEGHHVMIATGRPFRSSSMYYQELGLTTPIVNFNGAFVHHPLKDSWGVHHNPLDLHVVKDIVEASEAFKAKNILAEVMDDVYFHYHDETLLDIFGMGEPRIETGDLRTILKYDPTSVLIHAEESQVEHIRKHLSDVHAEVIDHRRWAAPWHVIEIVKFGLNKAVGIEKVASFYGIPKDRIIAFGDEDNDLEMIEYAGHGIAMGNAIPQLKNIASSVTLSNEDDGIALYLEDVLKLKF
ncbi:HAD family phosphatase [Bacillus luteolus]|uniref:HAD family phosphatase n=1 Tax=Litchfieldia luteola TaxID=682179 RepID=A0ABR9QLF9_9BACI|nr:Cof-type HAD-IIB family hydrolase [Cytobacillus luteolus]MBE4909327.1 HAD family phosphatase [Cytobacillus luteolus]MBP1940723.1 Cof subfamily protein (haloacid dehalogenase superfamily) [Cytobacillus luteolus]